MRRVRDRGVPPATKRVVALLWAIACVLLAACGSAPTRAPVENGVANLGGWDPVREPLRELSGTWRVTWGALPGEDGDVPRGEDEGFAAVPGLVLEGAHPPSWSRGAGTATYRVHLEGLPEGASLAILVPQMLASRIVCRNERGAVVAAGRNGVLPAAEAPRVSAYAATLPHASSLDCMLGLEVPAGRRAPLAGVWGAPFLGPADAIAARLERDRLKPAASAAFLLTLGLFFFGQWLLRRSEPEPALFAAAVSTLGLWIASFGGPIEALAWRMPFDPRHLEFAAVDVATYLFYLFSTKILGERVPFVHRALAPLAAVGALACVLVPSENLAEVLLLAQAESSVMALAIAVLGVRALLRSASDFEQRLFGGGVTCVAVFGAAEVVSFVVGGGALAGLTVTASLIFAFLMAIILARRNARVRRSAERFGEATARFVPQEFLSALGHRDVTTARLGDATTRELTVMFADIRNFTSISERMSPEETFAFLNGCLSRLGPHIREHGGFVDKYIGDGIMALFPGSPSDALAAALAMQREIGATEELVVRGYPLAIGIGLHFGPVMMGTIGEAQRFEATVIADTVNLTARIEGLTKQTGSTILMSGDVVDRLAPTEARDTRPLGLFAMKGKAKPVLLVEAFGAEPEGLRAQKRASAGSLGEAMGRYHRGALEASLALLDDLLAANPDDAPVRWWRDRVRAELGAGGEGHPRSVVRLDVK